MYPQTSSAVAKLPGKHVESTKKFRRVIGNGVFLKVSLNAAGALWVH